MDLDDAFRHLGNFGCYQILVYILLNLITCWLAAFQLMGMVYISYTPKTFYCTSPDGFNVSETVPVHEDKDGETVIDSCRMFDVQDDIVIDNLTGCQYGWEYETVHEETSVITDLNLVCDDAILGKIAQSLFMTGVLVGAVISGQLGDLFGRKKIVFVSMIGEALSGLGMALSWNYYLFVFFWFLLGVFEQGMLNCGYVMIMEMFVPEKRTLAGSICNIFWAVGVILVTPIAYIFPDWRHYQLFVSLICLLFLPTWWFIPESLRWLVSRRRMDEAEEILTTIAKFNKVSVPLPHFLDSAPLELHEEVVPLRNPSPYKQDAIYKPVPAPRNQIAKRPHSGGFTKVQSSTKVRSRQYPSLAHHQEAPPKTYTLLDVFKSKVLAINFFIMAYCWFCSSMVYYGLSLNSSNVAGNLYLNVFLLCLVELPATCLVYVWLKWGGRRLSLSVTLVITGIFCVLTACLPDKTSNGKDLTPVIITTATLGKFAISSTFGVIYVYTPEIFPTGLRTVGLGGCSFFARIGGIIAPFVLYLDKVSEFLPLNIFGILTILAGVFALIIPETRNKPLPETIEDCKQQGNASLCCWKQHTRLKSESENRKEQNASV